jgi:cell division protein FtsB
MRPHHLDPDMLEEQARLILNYGRPDEYLVIWPEGGESPQD